MKILCYGDSNTYGFDPRGFGGRYRTIWPDLLAAKLNCDMINAGENGREIPRFAGQLRAFCQLLEQESPVDLLMIMLGTNDLLQGNSPETAAKRMEAFLKQIPLEESRILLIAPPPMKPGAWVPTRQLTEDSVALESEYGALARRLGIRFAETGRWNISLAFDGVHFTEEGHRVFAEELGNLLNKGE